MAPSSSTIPIKVVKVLSGGWRASARSWGVALEAGTSRIALQAEEVNSVALRAYTRNGFVEVDRRPYVHFPGSQDSGDVILMCKEIS